MRRGWEQSNLGRGNRLLCDQQERAILEEKGMAGLKGGEELEKKHSRLTLKDKFSQSSRG